MKRPNLKLVPRWDLKPEPRTETLSEALLAFVCMLAALILWCIVIYAAALALGFPE